MDGGDPLPPPGQAGPRPAGCRPTPGDSARIAARRGHWARCSVRAVPWPATLVPSGGSMRASSGSYQKLLPAAKGGLTAGRAVPARRRHEAHPLFGTPQAAQTSSRVPQCPAQHQQAPRPSGCPQHIRGRDTLARVLERSPRRHTSL
jgi:hypothetical protein